MNDDKRDDDDKRADVLFAQGITRLGVVPSTNTAPPNPFSHVLVCDTLGRKGQRVKVIRNNRRIALVEFEDGLKLTLNSMAIRRG